MYIVDRPVDWLNIEPAGGGAGPKWVFAVLETANFLKNIFICVELVGYSQATCYRQAQYCGTSNCDLCACSFVFFV